jgi:hypothetical protein
MFVYAFYGGSTHLQVAGSKSRNFFWPRRSRRGRALRGGADARQKVPNRVPNMVPKLEISLFSV